MVVKKLMEFVEKTWSLRKNFISPKIMNFFPLEAIREDYLKYDLVSFILAIDVLDLNKIHFM